MPMLATLCHWRAEANGAAERLKLQRFSRSSVNISVQNRTLQTQISGVPIPAGLGFGLTLLDFLAYLDLKVLSERFMGLVA